MTPTVLQVAFREKDEVKRLGARWNGTHWYVPTGRDLTPFARWLPVQESSVAYRLDDAPELPVQGLSLREVMQRIRGCVQRGLPEALWIRAELTKVDTRPSGVFLELVERDETREVASAKAVIWQPGHLLARFHQHTGHELAAGLQVLAQARVEVQDRYGLRLVIEGLDPAYTVGVMARQLEVIRQTLQQEGIINANRQKPLPQDFFCVAVISPEGAAGLDDFQAEAAPLERFNICRFHYFTAIFQGPKTKDSLLPTLQAASALPDIQALVIIRGGGAVADLHWLNELELARAICQCPVPVITGIGHQRDQTILDEVAGHVEGTPSKVIGLIRKTIQQRAAQTREDVQTIQNAVQRRIGQADHGVAQASHLLRLAVHRQFEQAALRVEMAQREMIAHHRRALYDAEATLERVRHTLGNRVIQHIATMTHTIHQLQDRWTAQIRLYGAVRHRDLDQQRQAILAQSQTHLQHAAIRVTDVRAQVMAQAERWMRQATDEAWRLCREIRGQGPEKTLQRGFALVRDRADRPVTSRAAARQQSRLILEFHDGRMAVQREPDDE